MIRKSFAGRARMKIDGSRSSALKTAAGRLIIVNLFFIFAYILITVRAFDLTVLQGELVRLRGGEIVVPVKREEPDVRADIMDRNGELLATTLQTASLYADPALIIDAGAAATGIAKIFPDISSEKAYGKLTSDRRFVWIARNLTPGEQAKVLELGEPGLNFRTEPRRIYPYGKLAAHIVGFTDIDGNGIAGIEKGMDERLGRGERVSLCIDVRLQYFLHREMARSVEEFDAKGGAGIILDVASGEVMAAVSLPDFDPNDPGSASPDQLFNNASLGVFEPGSIFKIFSMAAYLEYEEASMGEEFDVREPLVRGEHIIKDYHPVKRPLTLPEVFTKSSNIGSVLIGERVGAERIQDFYRDLGLFHAPSGLAIPETGKPIVPDPWRESSTVTASYGHGIAVSPLQLVSAVATVVGDGTYVQPTFLTYDMKMANSQKAAMNNNVLRIVKPQTAHRMRQLLRLVVTDGTGSKAGVAGYQVGGKTGTAEKSGPGGYDSDRLLSSFVGIFPMESPKYAVLVMIDEPKGNSESYGYATGGWVAAPAVARIIAATGTLLGMTPVSREEDLLAEPLKKYIRSGKQDKKEKHLVSY